MSLAAQLDAYIAAQAVQPFGWAKHNCCHFAAGWLRAATGRDPMAGLPVTYSRTAARRLILQLGGTLADAWTRRLRRAPIAPELAQVGDIVLVPLGEASEAVGICTGRHAALLTAEDGLAMLPMRLATRAWRLRADGEESPPCAP